MAARGYRTVGNGDIAQAPASEAELTGDMFVRGVALALRAQWEGEDHFAVAASHVANPVANPVDDPTGDWSDYRAESEAVILTYLDMLKNQGFRIVRDLS